MGVFVKGPDFLSYLAKKELQTLQTSQQAFSALL